MATAATVASRRISPWSRIYGFGSVYAKTIRDSRLAFLIAVGLMGGLAFVMGAAVSQVFPSPESRRAVDNLIGSMPESMVNLFGKPVNLGTLGGYMSWKYGATFVLGVATWSILALSGTLATEANRGSLDFVATSPLGKRRIALEKVLAHVTMLGLAMGITAVLIIVSSNTFGDASLGDRIPPIGAIGFALLAGFVALFFGGLAFALSPLLGRSGAAGLAALLMMVTWIANGFSALDPIAVLSPFRWVSNHIPLAGWFDWAPLALIGIAAVAFLAIGIELFTRRDLGVTAGLSLPHLPSSVLGVRGPISRSFGDQLPRALAWGLGLFAWSVILVSLSSAFADQIAKDTELTGTFSAIFPGLDFSTAGAWLQLFAELLFIAAGLAATTFVSKWASDEQDGRLEMVLATPESRARWVVTGGIAAILAVVVMTALFAAGTGIGAAAGGVSATDGILGSLALGLFAIAVVGVGVAIGGLWRTSVAAEIAALLVIVTYLIDMLAPPLKLPEWSHKTSLLAHLGQPMIGQWDLIGIVLCVAIAVGGILLGAWGIRRRDVD